MKIHDFIQGSPEWHAHRKTHFNASDAPAMLGVSPYKTRTQLLHEKHTGIANEVDAGTQKRFDDGHRFEALARPIAEQIIGEELFPVTGSEGKYSASFDGLTMMEDVALEHKTLNDEIRACETVDDLPELYTVQMEQQCLVSGCEKVLFLATKWDDNDNLIEQKHFWYTPMPELRQRIIAGWEQFERDLAAYVPKEIKEAPKAEPVESFPVPAIQVRGELVACNLADITPRFDKFLAETNTELKTDEDFAQGEADGKASREAAKALKLKAKEVVDQIAPVSEVVRTLETYAAKFDALGLKLEKAVKEQKEAIKTKIAMDARTAYQAHIMTLEAEIFPIRMQFDTPDFGGAMKGMRTIASLHNAVDTLLSQSKVSADAVARDLRTKLAWYKENSSSHNYLFHDLQQIITKPLDDFQLVVNTRIEQHQKAEAERIEAERQRIQQEEQAVAGQLKDAITTGIGVVKTTFENGSPQVQHIPVADVIDTGATIKLGQICERLGFTVSAEFIRSLGVEPAGRERAAVLYRESDFPKICDWLIGHIQSVRNSAIEGMRKAA